jgi:hypothetical protein
MDAIQDPLKRLTLENSLKGFLIDEELMAGVSPIPETSRYSAFVLRHTTGELLGQQEFGSLQEAIETLNAVQRDWTYESSSQCGGGACTEGNCGTGSCKKVLSRLSKGSPSPEACELNEPCHSQDPAQ